MVKKLRFQENRSQSRRRRRDAPGRWVIEPIDVALAAAVLAVVLWLQWLLAALPS
jgi:hypothetical protein